MEDYPVSEYYKGHIEDGTTISRSASWWSAILVIKDPKTEKTIIKIYKWQFDSRINKWKNIEEFKINDKVTANKIIMHLKAFSELL